MSIVSWTEDDAVRSARWHSESAAEVPNRIVVVDDRLRADTAVRLARPGSALLWRGDYHNGRGLVAAMRRRLERKAAPPQGTPAEMYVRMRAERSRRATVLSRVVVELDQDYALNLRRAPDVRRACEEAYGSPDSPMLVPLRELLGVLGAREWRAKGVEVPALGARIHPHYGVFAPVRGEYVDLLAAAPLPAGTRTAFDIGTGTGVLAAVLARRGVDRVLATDVTPRAVACARDNVTRLGLSDRIEVRERSMFPEARADLIVCNPPWLPAQPSSQLEQGVYDADGVMLRDFLTGLPAHLFAGGEGWLILSNLAELLGLRAPGELTDSIENAGLRILDRLDTHPRHPRARDRIDPLHRARAAETTTLWRLAAR